MEKLFSFFYFSARIWWRWPGHGRQIFWVRQIAFFPHFYFIMEPLQEDPTPKQANARLRGCSSGIPNYCNDLLIDIVKQLLPQGVEAWRRVS